jgi:hypothetical protein
MKKSEMAKYNPMLFRNLEHFNLIILPAFGGKFQHSYSSLA